MGTILIQGSNSIKAEVKAIIAASEERMKERIDESAKRLEKRIAESEERIGGVLKEIKAGIRELNTTLNKAQ